jgi:hypothetical protein
MKTKHVRNGEDYFDKYKFIPMLLGTFFFLLFIIWIISNICRWKWQWGLSEYSVVLFLLLGTALFLFPLLERISLPGGIAFTLRNLPKKVKEIYDVQLLGEVIFNEKVPSELFWIDKNRFLRRLPNKDVAMLFMTSKGSISVSKKVLDNFNPGSNLPLITSDNFKHIGDHIFLILDNMIFYLSSFSLPVKYGHTTTNNMKEIDLNDFEKYQIIR